MTRRRSKRELFQAVEELEAAERALSLMDILYGDDDAGET